VSYTAWPDTHTAHQLEQTAIGGVRHPVVVEMEEQELGGWVGGWVDTWGKDHPRCKGTSPPQITTGRRRVRETHGAVAGLRIMHPSAIEGRAVVGSGGGGDEWEEEECHVGEMHGVISLSLRSHHTHTRTHAHPDATV
jgi:hypothetical protein